MGPEDGTSQEGSFGPTADAVEPPTGNAETCPACRAEAAGLVFAEMRPLFALCNDCGHRWHIWPMSGRWEHLRRAAQIALAAL